MLSLDIKIPHLKIAPLVGNLEVGNLEDILFDSYCNDGVSACIWSNIYVTDLGVSWSLFLQLL